MRKSLCQLLPIWFVCLLLPVASLFFRWRPVDGRVVPKGLFFIDCASLVAYAFRSDIKPPANEALEHPDVLWRRRMETDGTALVLASITFSLLWLSLIDGRDFAAVFLAGPTVIPTLCIVPYLTLITRKPFAAVLFTIAVVFIAKCTAGAVVVSVYGWNASKHVPPYTDLPWEAPHLHVWVFLVNTAILCIVFYLLGKRKFQAIYERAGSQPLNQTP
jgi:hypothetical protein